MFAKLLVGKLGFCFRSIRQNSLEKFQRLRISRLSQPEHRRLDLSWLSFPVALGQLPLARLPSRMMHAFEAPPVAPVSRTPPKLYQPRYPHALLSLSALVRQFDSRRRRDSPVLEQTRS